MATTKKRKHNLVTIAVPAFVKNIIIEAAEKEDRMIYKTVQRMALEYQERHILKESKNVRAKA